MIKKLERYKDTKEEIEKLKERIIKLENSLISPRISNISDLPRSSSHMSEHLTEDLYKLNELKSKYMSIVYKLCDQQLEIEEMIAELEPIERELVRLRYFDELPWWKISNELHYGQRQVFNIHNKIIKKLKKR